MRDLLCTTLLLVAFLPFVACGDAEPDADPAPGPPASDVPGSGAEGAGVAVEGFSGPESALHDAEADVYLVSNLVGSPSEKDGDGFISRVSPAGEVLDLRWIDGTAEGTTLHAPKGMGMFGDTLIVADVDEVRLFDRRSGRPIGNWSVEGATFLNDVAVAADGTVYVSDTGIRFEEGEAQDAGTSRIYAFSLDGSRRTVDTGDYTRINGLAVADDRLYGVTSGSGRVFVIEGETLSELPELPGLGLDGVVVTERGLLISDWDTETVYLLRDNGSLSVIARNVASPADIGIDRRRGRLLIPGLTTDKLLLAPLE